MRKGLTILLLLIATTLAAQQELNDVMVERIESLVERYDGEVDMTDMTEQLYDLIEQPVMVNMGDPEENLRIPFLSELMAYNLAGYVMTYGAILSVNELLGIDGFTPELVEMLPLFISLEVRPEKEKFSLKNLFFRPRSRMFLRYQRVLEQQSGYLSESGEAPAYAGTADKYYMRYNLSTRQLSLGVTAEKDAGEQFFGPTQTYGFDFLSLHGFYSGKGFVRAVAVGDYHLRFGQGLTLWSGLSFGKSGSAVQVMRYGNGIKPNSSANENAFLRGAAVELRRGDIKCFIFASSHRLDATVDTLSDGEEALFSTIQESGLHRTESELAKRNAILQQLGGVRFSYRGGPFSLGTTAFATQYDIEHQQGVRPDQLYDFSGSRLVNVGLDFHAVWHHFVFFGEGGYSSSGGFAGIAGFDANLTQQFALSVLYRNYSKTYVNYFSNAFAEGSRSQNEEGFYMGSRFLLHKRWTLFAYADFFRFPWLRYGVDAPSHGVEYLAQLNFSPSRNADLYLRFKDEKKEQSAGTLNAPLPALETIEKQSVRFHATVKPLWDLVLKCRAEWSTVQEQGSEKHHGFLIYQDINYDFNARLSTAFRYALFETYSYDERIYAYESDLLYAFSVPAYYYTGSRVYLLVNYKISPAVTFWAKVGSFLFSDRESVGSGNDEIAVPHKTEVRFQLRIKI